MRRIGIAYDELGEGILLELGQEVEPREAFEIVEAVALLKGLELVLEDKGEGGAEHAAEKFNLFSEAADPQIDAAETRGRHAIRILGQESVVRPGAGAVQEVDPVTGCHDGGREIVIGPWHPVQPVNPNRLTGHDRPRRGALAGKRVLQGDQVVGAIGGDEVDHRQFMFHILREIDPALIRLQLEIARTPEKFGAHRIERRNTYIASAGDVDRRKVKRQAHQIVAKGLGDKLVDLVAGDACHAAHDGAGRLDRGLRVLVIELQRVEEGPDQPELLAIVQYAIVDDREVGVEAVDRLRQHRMAKAINGLREFHGNRRIDRRVIAAEDIDQRLNLACEFFKDEMLILHLGTKFRGLEQAVAVPHQGVDFRLCDGHRQHGFQEIGI